MRNKIPEKILIIGSVGSGKTTFAQQLSTMLNIPFYEVDNIVWERQKSGDRRRTEEEREVHLNSIIHSETWIIEGVHNEDWVSGSFQNADLILFLDTKFSIRTYRIIKRFVFQKLRLEKSNYKPTLEIFFKMFKWNRHFEEVGKPTFFNKFGIYSEKLLVIRNKKDMADFFRKLT